MIADTEGWIVCGTCGMAIMRIDREQEGGVWANVLVPLHEKEYCLSEPVKRVHVEPDLSIICPKVTNGAQ